MRTAIEMPSFSLPICLEVARRRAVVIGGGRVGEDKTRALLEAGAEVTVISERFTNGLQELARRGEVTLVGRDYAPGDLQGAFLAVAATNCEPVNRQIHAEATELGVLLNAVDDPARCHFSFPSVLRRGDLSVAISTGGRAPALAKWLRKRLSRSIGNEYGVLVDVVAEARAETLALRRQLAFGDWAQRWQQALGDDLLTRLRREGPTQAKAVLLARLADPAPSTAPGGRVAIVGAGPGDAGLLTERGRHLLDTADVVVFDRLVPPDLVEGKDAIYVGKEPGATGARRGPTQAQINILLVALALQGRQVVRLKGGDPFLFGRGAEEAEALAAAGVDFEVVPAPSSAMAALAYAGIPVTDRRFSSSVAVVTGRPSRGRAVQWRALAGSVDTLVVLMGTGVLGHIVEELLAGGLNPATPSAMVENGTTPLQRVVTSPVAELPARAAAAGLRSPSVVVIGEVVRLRDRIRWFDRALEDRTAATRPNVAREGQPT